MKKNSQTILLGLAILLILTALVAGNAETPQTTASKITYNYYWHTDSDFLKKYHRFLPSPVPEGLYYHTRLITTANIDDTPEKENVAFIVIDTKPRLDFSNCVQAFLLIANTQAQKIEKKAFFKLFDTGTYEFDVPAAKSTELHNPPFALTQPTRVSFRLVDVTDDGTLDIWVESVHGVALISFQDGAFKEVFSNYTVSREKLAKTPDIEDYNYNRSDPEEQKYHRLLTNLPPRKLFYVIRGIVAANIDNTVEKEHIVLITADTEPNQPPSERESLQAFLLIAENALDGLKKKELFKMFTAGHYEFDVPGKSIAVQSAPFVFREGSHSHSWASGHVFFRLVDLTGDGILDIWVESYNGVVVISFQNGEFVEVCSAYSSIRREAPIEYIDLNNDGTYEIKIPDRISIDRIDNASAPEWVSFYEWDGNTYVLNNQRFYANNDEFLSRLLGKDNAVLNHYGRSEEYSFYIGLIYFYRRNVPMARQYLQWVVENGKDDDYIQAAKDLLKKLMSR